MPRARVFVALLLLLAVLVPAQASALNLCLVRDPGSPRCIIDGGVVSSGSFTGVRISEWEARKVCVDQACTPWIVTCVGVGVWVDGSEVYDTGDTVCSLA